MLLKYTLNSVSTSDGSKTLGQLSFVGFPVSSMQPIGRGSKARVLKSAQEVAAEYSNEERAPKRKPVSASKRQKQSHATTSCDVLRRVLECRVAAILERNIVLSADIVYTITRDSSDPDNCVRCSLEVPALSLEVHSDWWATGKLARAAAAEEMIDILETHP